MLVINSREVYKSISPVQMIAAMEDALAAQHQKTFEMPNRMHIDHRKNTFLLMPCLDQTHYSTKLVSVFPGNKEFNLPVLQGGVVLSNNYTGQIEAFIHGATLTSMRTGAIGAVGAKHLSKPDARTIGLFGTGEQGVHQCWMIAKVRDIEEIYLYDHNPESTKAFLKRMKYNLPNVRVTRKFSKEDVVRDGDIIVLATNSNEPVFRDDPNLYEDKCFLAIGSYKPNMKEIPDGLFQAIDKYYLDTLFAKEESGDVKIPIEQGLVQEDKIQLLSEAIHTETIDKKSTKLFKSVGMALFDLYASKAIFANAQKKEIGTDINFD